jgi:Matrixin/PEP-CTERM motif
MATRILVVWAAFSCAFFLADPAHADPFRWRQPGGLGTPVVLTYSFSNLLDHGFPRDLTETDIRASTAEAFGLWSHYAPLNFFERPDSGPPPSDHEYAPGTTPNIRIGYDFIDEETTLAHAFLPVHTDESGLAGDIHFNATSAYAWSVGAGFPTIDFLEVITHEIGHSLGVGHILYADAIMQPYVNNRFRGRGTAYLLEPDILAIRSLYGSGVGSVHPMPEPSTVLLLATGLALVLLRRHTARRQQGDSTQCSLVVPPHR